MSKQTPLFDMADIAFRKIRNSKFCPAKFINKCPESFLTKGFNDYRIMAKKRDRNTGGGRILWEYRWPALTIS